MADSPMATQTSGILPDVVVRVLHERAPAAAAAAASPPRVHDTAHRVQRDAAGEHRDEHPAPHAAQRAWRGRAAVAVVGRQALPRGVPAVGL